MLPYDEYGFPVLLNDKLFEEGFLFDRLPDTEYSAKNNFPKIEQGSSSEVRNLVKRKQPLAERIFFMNKYPQEPDKIIDLHGHTMREVQQILNALMANRDVAHVRLIVGKGNHSQGVAILRDFVKGYLSARNMRFNQSKLKDGGEGALEVFW